MQPNKISDETLSAYPILRTASYIRSLSPIVPLAPDTVFNIFNVGESLMALVSTDYVDISEHSTQLRAISGEYRLSYIEFITVDGDTVSISDAEINPDKIFYRSENTYFYLVKLTDAIK